jgi:hypothetical protein
MPLPIILKIRYPSFQSIRPRTCGVGPGHCPIPYILVGREPGLALFLRTRIQFSPRAMAGPPFRPPHALPKRCLRCGPA